jgi:hypothetical protein
MISYVCVGISKYSIMVAASMSLSLPVFLWCTGSREQGIRDISAQQRVVRKNHRKGNVI